MHCGIYEMGILDTMLFLDTVNKAHDKWRLHVFAVLYKINNFSKTPFRDTFSGLLFHFNANCKHTCEF